MKLIPLTQGYFAKVDDDDYKWLIQFKWRVFKSPNKKVHYARTNCSRKIKTGPKQILMHRLISKAASGTLVDHTDGDGLNNQKINLRLATKAQNNANRNASGKSTFLGVYVSTTCKYRRNKQGELKTHISIKWRALLSHNNKQIHLGNFPFTPDGEIAAAKVYDEAAKRYHGEFANLNFKS